jgi:glycosyltransferase involved in cell wall biosynthesis
MKNHPLVSVIIPVYNSEKYLAATLDSVFAQTYRPIEVIVVDDGSIDNSSNIVHDYPEVRYFHQSNQGVSVARNVAIAAAQGEFIAFLDADDLWKPDKLSIQIVYMLEHPNLGFTGTNALNFLEPDTQVPHWFQPDLDLGELTIVIPSTLVVRKTVFSQIGNFSSVYRASEDIEWLWRAKDARIPTFTIPETLTFRRFHGANLSWAMEPTHKSRLLKIVRESISRQNLNGEKPSID